MEHVNTFIKGLDKDTSDLMIDPQRYRHLLNGDIIYDSGEDSGVLVDIKGNSVLDVKWASDTASYSAITGYPDVTVKLAVNPYDAKYKIVGIGYMRDDIVLVYTDAVNEVKAIIDVLKYEDGEYTRINLLYEIDLNIRKNSRLELELKYEHPAIIKMYFIEKNNSYTITNQLRTLNISPDVASGVVKDEMLQGSYTRYTTLPAYGIGMVGKVTSSDLLKPEFSSFGSGSLRSGAYVYVYRYVNEYGSMSKFSDVSNVIYLTNSRDFSNSIVISGSTTTGTFNEMNSYKSINMEIPGNANYEYVEVIRLWYSALHGIPEGHIIRREKLSTSDLIVEDSNYDSVITPFNVEELNQYNLLFAPATFASKDDRLFIGNIVEDYFDIDFDARAYSFDKTTGIAKLYKEGDYTTAEYTIDSATFVADCGNVEEDADVVNPTNIVGYDYDSTRNVYRYKKDLTTLGASGLNVEIDFVDETIDIDALKGVGQYSNYFATTMAEKYGRGEYKSFQGDEVYRVGLIFKDEYGRTTPVKYVADIRIPDKHKERVLAGTASADITHVVHVYIPHVTVTKVGTEAEGLQHQVVFVKREAKDRTVLSEGLAPYLQPAQTSANFDAWYDYGHSPFLYAEYNCDTGVGSNTYIGAAYIHHDPIIGVVSPEVYFNKNTNFGSTYIDALYAVDVQANSSSYSFYNDGIKLHSSIGMDVADIATREQPIYQYYRASEAHYHTFTGSRYTTQDDTLVLSGSEKTIDSKLVSSLSADYVDDVDSGAHSRWHVFYGDACSTHYIKLNSFITSLAAGYVDYVRVRRDITQYGGRSYSARNSNIYIKASDFTSGTSSYMYYGDTFYQHFEYQRTQYPVYDRNPSTAYDDHPYHHKVAETVLVPVQSSINLNYRSGETFSTLRTAGISTPLAMQVRETGLGYYQIVRYFEDSSRVSFHESEGTYTTLKPTNMYNSVYSIIGDFVNSVALEDDYLRNSHFDTRVRYSDEKINGEFYDSWLIYRPANFRDLDTKYGSLTFLQTFNNILFAWQDTSVVRVNVNPKVQVPAGDGTSMIIGTGAVLNDFIYLSTEVGMQGINETVNSVSAMYWLDNNKKKVYRFLEGIETLSDTKLLAGFFKRTISQDTLFIGAYDNIRKTVLMSIINYVGDEVFVNDFEVTHVTPLIITGSVDSLMMRVGLQYELEDSSGNTGEYKLDNITDTSMTFEKISGDDLALVSIGLEKYSKYYNTYTLAFDEKGNFFKSFESFIPTLYIKGNKQVFTVPDVPKIYEHNVGDYRTFYGVEYPLVLDIVINSNPLINKSYGALEIDSDVRKGAFDRTDPLDYTGRENITFTEIMARSNRNLTEYLKLYTKTGKIPDEIIAGEHTDNIDGDIYTDPVVDRVIQDTNGIRIIPYPDYLYNVRMRLNKFRTLVPRVKTLISDETYTDPITGTQGRLITELLQGTTATLRLIFFKSNTDQLRVKNILTYYNINQNV